MIKYGVVEYSFRYKGFLQSDILIDDYSDIKQAERFRSDWLKVDPKMNPQNVQVFQYACEE